MNKNLTFLILAFFCLKSFATIQESNQEIQKLYPETRIVTSLYSIIFGSMAIWQGSRELSLDKPQTHDHLGIMTVAIGSARLIDGSIGMFRPYEAERLANNNKITDQETLERLSKQGMYSRILRSSLIAGNSFTFLSLYSKGDKEYRPLIYPGIIMAIISTGNLLNLSPEEKAWKKYQKSNLSYNIFPDPKGFIGSISYHFP
jgi:hypothetical protein